MRLKPKTVRRLLLVAVVAVVVLGAAFSLFVVRRWQTNRRTDAHRREGLAAFAQGRYRKTIEELGRYVQRGRTGDAEVWLALAKAGQALDEPDYAHLRSAVRSYVQYLTLRPDDSAARLALLKLCNQAGSYVEARDEAERLRPAKLASAGPEHIEVLREEAIALTAAKLYAARLDSVVDRLLELAPLDLQGHLIRLESWGKTERRNDARRGAQALAASHPDSPVAQLILAASYLVEPTPDDIRIARVKLAQAVGLDPRSASVERDVVFPTADFVSRAVDLLDRVQAFDLSFGVLRQWRSQNPNAPADRLELGLLRTLARRLWQQADRTALASLVESSHADHADSEVLAFQAMAFFQSNDPNLRQRAEAIARLLETRKDDYRATAWAQALPIADPARVSDPKVNVETLKAIIKATNRSEPVFLVMLGESYAALSRLDDARQSWKAASESPVCVSWWYPCARRAETHLNEGHAQEAVEAATQALLIAPESPTVNALWFESQASLVQQGSPGGPSPANVLSTLERVIAQVERAGPGPEMRAVWERLLPVHILFLARTEQAPRALAVARAALAADTPLAEHTLQRLASVSASERLGIEKECLDRAAAMNESSPGVALARAMELARLGRVVEGLAVVRAAAAAADNARSRLAVAQYLDQTGHADALPTWIALGDRFVEEIAVQRACLWSSAAIADAEFIERTIARYQKLAALDRTAAEDAVVRTARARVLLRSAGGSPTPKDRDTAIAMLSQVVTTNPKLVEPKLFLARALLMSDAKRGIRADEARAVIQLVDALALAPRSGPIALELASLYQRTRDFTRSRDLLTRVASDATADPSARHAAARMLLGQGPEASAVALRALEEIDAQGPASSASSPVSLLVDLAEAYVQQRQDDNAGKVFQRIINDPSVDADRLFLAARFHQRRGNPSGVQAVMDRLEKTGVAGAESAMLARLADDRNDIPTANKHFEEAVTANPAADEYWRAYITSLLARGNAPSAMDVAQRAIKAAPASAALKVLLEQARLAATSDGSLDFAPMIAAMADDPAMAGASDVLKALEEARQRGDLDRPDRVLVLAEQFPGVAPLQMYLAQRLANRDPEKAAVLIGRARSAAPSDARLARAAAELFLNMGRWTDLIAAATVWRDTDTSAEPDVAIAQARLNLHDYRGGLAVLEPWVKKAVADPEAPTSLGVLNIQTRLLIASGQEARARELLAPLTASSGNVRAAIWLRAAAEVVPDLSTARSWIEQVRPLLPPDSADQQLAAAGALSVLASRFPSESAGLLSEAKSTLQSLTQRPDTATASVWEALGVVSHRLNDLPAARSAYEKANALDNRRPISLNNLASLLSEREGDLDTALGLAQRAVDVAGDEASLSTLGSIQHAIGLRQRKAGTGGDSAFRQAARTYERIALMKGSDAKAWSMAADSAADAGDFAAAAAAWERVTELPGLSPVGQAAAKNNLAASLLRQNTDRDGIERARRLSAEAITIAPEPSYYDTLGWAELQAGKRDRAIDAFRKALGTDTPAESPVRSAVIGLATALATGAASERREAADLAAAIDPSTLEPYLIEKLQKVRSLVQADKP